jgi:hypothetical protein
VSPICGRVGEKDFCPWALGSKSNQWVSNQ